jgi:glycosyltransferase involved in cell wall biosynthesis
VHGWAPYLAETLDGILGQQPPPSSVVVVDDGSAEPVRLHPDHAPHCQLVRRERRGGLATARATGWSHLDTELVALCDADDTWAPGSLAARVDALERVPEAAVVFGRALIVGPDDRPTGERWDEIEPGPHAAPDLLPFLFEYNPVPVSSAVMRGRALGAAGGLGSDLPYAEDWDLWLRLLSIGAGFVFEARAVVRYRRAPGALSGDVAGLARAVLEVHDRHGALVDEEVRRRVRWADLGALADGLVRERRYREARQALRQAAGLGPLPRRHRLRRPLLSVPGLRAALGRRDPYRRTD